jgi:hypothetical protein
MKPLRLVPSVTPQSQPAEKTGGTWQAVNSSEPGAYSPSLFILVTAEIVRSAWQAIYGGRDA